MNVATALTLSCLVLVAGLMAADHRDWPLGRVLCKVGASSSFVLLAWVLGAAGTRYGQLVLAALLLGWLGDVLLLSRQAAAFMAGLVAFLLSHLFFAAAFVVSGWALPAAALATVVAAGTGHAVLRWLLPHTPPGFRKPVWAYVLVILAMCACAAGHAWASGRPDVLIGALLFAASDVAVARDRFVRPGPANRRWGWPTYYVAQLMLAWSVAARV